VRYWVIDHIDHIDHFGIGQKIGPNSGIGYRQTVILDFLPIAPC
jgi:hypothetical protein